MNQALLSPPQANASAITLRPYQAEAVNAVYDHLRTRDDNPCVVIPTAGGKTPVMAAICRDAVTKWNGRVLILAHVKELLEQAVDKLHAMAPDLTDRIGVYSAGLKSRDTDHPIIVAGIQSVYRRAAELDRFDLILVDEAHMIPPDGDGMYQTFLAEAKVVNPLVRLVGLTATPYRMTTGMICGPENLLNHVCYEVGVRELIVQGYLCPLVSKAGREKADTSGLHVRGGEFIAGEVEDLMDETGLVESACREIVDYTRQRRSCLIFTSGIRHGRHVAETLARLGRRAETVFGDTPSAQRDRVLKEFREGNLKYLVNVNVLTTGFDAPNIDCVALLRPTMSPGLYYQMCLDMDTEVLTPSGWRRCHEITTGDEVATFDLESEEIVYVRAEDKVHRPLRPHESMYGVQAPHLDIRVTNLHNLVVRSKSHTAKRWRLQPAAEAATRRDTYTIPVAGYGRRHEADAPLTDAEVAFLGWFLTDGYRHRVNNTVSISQSNAKYVGEIRAVLEACGFGFREYRQVRTGRQVGYQEGVSFVIPHGAPRGGNTGKRGWNSLAKWLDKDVPAVYDSLSRRQFYVLLRAMDMANGRHPNALSYRKRTMDIAVGCRRRMADRIQQLAVERGFRCNITKSTPMPNGWNRHPQHQWMLHVREQRVAYVGGTAAYPNPTVRNRCRLGPVSYETNEWVWCLTTEYGTLVTRRNGKVAILGNCGRGFRIHPGKADCLVLDFGGNVMRHGPVDAIRIREPGSNGNGQAPAKECPQCRSVIAISYAVCPDCGYEFPEAEEKRRAKHSATASSEGILSGEVTVETYQVQEVAYSVHVKRDAPEDHPRSMRVDYRIGFNRWQSEWICLEHTGYARHKAEAWWRQRSNVPVPDTAEEGVYYAQSGALAETKSITVKSVAGEQFDRIVGYELGEKPFYREPGWDDEEIEPGAEEEPCLVGDSDEEVPF